MEKVVQHFSQETAGGSAMSILDQTPHVPVGKTPLRVCFTWVTSQCFFIFSFFLTYAEEQ